MEPVRLALLAGAAVSAGLHLRAHYTGARRQVYLFKPLTTALLLALALVPADVEPRYRLAVAAGLLLSLAGDVFLMLPRDRFASGLASFLVAHLAYLVAFTAGVPLFVGLAWWAPYVVGAGAMLAVLWPRLGRMRAPVALYVAVIVAMAGQAAGRADALGTPQALAAAGGAALFVVSDAALAFDRFHTRFAAAQAVVMTTYVAAQALIALSAGLP